MKKLAGLLLFALASCRTADPAGGFETKNDVANASAAQEACRDVTATSTEEFTGDHIFELTSRCVFSRDVHNVHIRILGETFQKVLDDGCADRDDGYGHVLELSFNGHKIQNVGIKVRGNTSRCNAKRQFKLVFDEEEMFSVWQGQKSMKTFPENADRSFMGLAGISLRSSENDPSMIRERLSSRVFAAAEDLGRTTERGALVYRAAFAKFFVSFNRPLSQGPEGTFNRAADGFYYDYKGFYTLTENIDKTFLTSRFQKGDQKLKGFYLYQADKGQGALDIESVPREGWSIEYADGKKAKKPEQIQDAEAKLLQLTQLLKTGTAAKIAEKVDVDSIVNYTSGVILTGHWDSLLANANNDFLFFNGATKKWQVIVWDLDNTFGVIYDLYKDYMQDDIYGAAKKRPNLLFTSMFAADKPDFRAKLKQRLKAMNSGAYSASQLDSSVEWLESFIKNSAEPWEGYNQSLFVDIKNFGKARSAKLAPQL